MPKLPRFEHKARQHFQNRWRERIGEEYPPYHLLKDAMRDAARGTPSDVLTFVRAVPPHSSRWRAVWRGKPVILVYDHAMKLPVTCWPEEEKEVADA